MSAEEKVTDFERRARASLEASLMRVDGHVRSRLNQARHLAVAEAASRGGPFSFWLRVRLMPAIGAVAAAILVALFLGSLPQHHVQPPQSDLRPAVEDLDLLADADGLDLVQSDGSFYEWAMAQTTDGNAAPGPGT